MTKASPKAKKAPKKLAEAESAPEPVVLAPAALPPAATFKEAVEREFGPGASYMAEGVMKRFVNNPRPEDPTLPAELEVFEPKRQANLKRFGR